MPTPWRVLALSLPQSTEETVDDWGADFIGGIVLTPKISGAGSAWSMGQEAFREEEEDSDDSCAAMQDHSVRPTDVGSCARLSP